ncbi:MAG: DUF1259 domain-containing protein [Bacillaceae bacterium]|nr:DUF1259 domain-containing protein [Bacillaceae bacterium]
MSVNRTLCRRFARILNGTPSISNGVCTVSRLRHINVRIFGRRTRSPLVLPQLYSFENRDRRGRALNLGETVILQEEINPYITRLRQGGITVTALHNHWLFENPRLFYIHYQSVEDPIRFARKVARANRVLKR